MFGPPFIPPVFSAGDAPLGEVVDINPAEGSTYPLIDAGTIIGSASIVRFSAEDTEPTVSPKVIIKITANVTDKKALKCIYRWRQRYTIQDGNGNYLSKPGLPPANNRPDPDPPGPKEYYWTDVQRKVHLSADGVSETFFDDPGPGNQIAGLLQQFPQLKPAPGDGGYKKIIYRFKLELVKVKNEEVTSGGTPVLYIGWGFEIYGSSPF